MRKGIEYGTVSGRPSIFSGKKKNSDAAVIISINTSQSQTSFFSADKGMPISGKQSILAKPLKLGEKETHFSEINLVDPISGGPVIRHRAKIEA
jgi:hypothetical protein